MDGDEATPVPEAVQEWCRRLARAKVSGLDDDARLALLRGLEDLSRVIGAVSVEVQVAFEASQVGEQAARGVPASRRGRAVADDLAHARKTSPYRASRELTSSRALVHEMPRTWAALRAGTIDELQARRVTEATVCLSPADRGEVDRRLSTSLAGASTRQIVAAARALTYEVDPAGFVGRARRAVQDRGVSLRPTPDVMALLSARLPAPQAIAVFTSLQTSARSLRTAGDPRTVPQLMADLLYARLTGREVVDGVDVEVGLVMTDAALFGGDHGAADLLGYGPVPAELARDLLYPSSGDHACDHGHEGPGRADPDDEGFGQGSAPPGGQDPTHPDVDGSVRPDGQDLTCPRGGRCDSASCSLVHDGSAASHAPTEQEAHSGGRVRRVAGDRTQRGGRAPTQGGRRAPRATNPVGLDAAKVWLRRLYVEPVTGVLATRDPRRRLFTGSLRSTLIMRGRYCANAWCGAPVRHVDHARRWSDGGLTDEANARGLCARCNLAREHPRHADPGPESYRPPPPLLDGFLGRPPPPRPVRPVRPMRPLSPGRPVGAADARAPGPGDDRR